MSAEVIVFPADDRLAKLVKVASEQLAPIAKALRDMEETADANRAELAEIRRRIERLERDG
jgi:hypothetical protein